MNSANRVNTFAICLVAVAAVLLGYGNYHLDRSAKLLNVSYDPIRELYAELNPRFINAYRDSTGHQVRIEQSHGGSSRQNEAILREPHDHLPDIALFPITPVARDWDDAQTKFFGDNGIFHLIHPDKAQ